MGLFDKINVNVNLGSSNPHPHDSHGQHPSGGNPHANRNYEFAREHHHHHHGHDYNEYFAVVEQGGLFFSGNLPDIKWGNVSLCRTYDELIDKLTQKLNEEMESAAKWNKPLPAKTSYNELAAKYPGKKIVAIRPSISR